MIVEQARNEYAAWGRVLAENAADHDAGWLSHLPLEACTTCAYTSLQVDGASIALDLAIAESVTR